MPVIISPEHPANPDATALIAELDAHLGPLYPRESQHGFSVEKLIADAVAFFVIRDSGAAAGCGGIKLFGTDYGEVKRMWVRPAFRDAGTASSCSTTSATTPSATGSGFSASRPASISTRRFTCTSARDFSESHRSARIARIP